MSKHGSNIALALLIGLVGWMIFENQRGSMQGEEAMDFSLPVLDSSEELGPQDFAGKVVLIDFWATYCGPCAEEMPGLGRLVDSFDESDFRLLSVNVDPPSQRDVSQIRRWQRHFRMEFPILLDPGPVSDAYGVTSIPHVVLIDRLGTVRFVHNAGNSEYRLRREIAELIAEPG